jgi:hypothetical protein
MSTESEHTRGSWSEDRLWVLRSIDELKAGELRLAESAAADRAALLDKATRDINSAHEKIRSLEASRISLRLKNWVMTLVISAIGTLAFELIKAWLHGWKP